MGNAEGTLGHLEVDRDKSEVYEDWMMAPGELDGTQVTVFSAAHPSSSRKRPYIERALQASRVYRHPGLLRYIDGGVVSGEVVVVTERASPLRHHDLQTFSPLHISAGLLSIIETLVFLHDRAGVSHNNVSASSIFITPDGAWKLWGLEYSCSFGKLTRDHVEHINGFCHESAVPPDDKTRISPSYQHARDSYAFGHLVEDVLTSQALAEVGGASDFLDTVKRSCLAPSWNQRPKLTQLSQHPVFSHHFLKLHETLNNILLLNDHNRDEFVKSVGGSLEEYPEELVCSTMAGSLLSRPVLLHPAAATHLMPRILTPRTGPRRVEPDSGKEDDEGGGGGKSEEIGLFGEDVFRCYIVPQIVRLFGVHDATVRSILLTHLPTYVNLVPNDVLAEDVLPELLLGIKDSSDALVSSTLHALAYLVPILGASVVVGENRHNLFTTAKPKPAAVLPLSKGVLVREPLVNGISVTNSHPSPSPTTRSPESSPPPPPPRSISLDTTANNITTSPDSTSLDNLSLDGLTLTHIPERSSPDGGEDHTEPPTHPVTHPGLGEGESWSSDWEDLQEGVAEAGEVYGESSVLSKGHKSVNFKGTEGPLGFSVKGSSLGSFKDSNLSLKLLGELGESNVVSLPKLSSGMKLVSSGRSDKPPTPPPPKKQLSLGEEFDVMAIKVNKKRDAELDLFADLAPSFTTKKFDLETLLVEANHRAKGLPPLERTPSVSETLAGLDTNIEGDAWGDDSEWDDPLDLPDIPSPPLKASPVKLVNSLVSETRAMEKETWDDWGEDF